MLLQIFKKVIAFKLYLHDQLYSIKKLVFLREEILTHYLRIHLHLAVYMCQAFFEMHVQALK